MNEAVTTRPNRISRWPYLTGGYVLFALGALGIVVPGLPTTVFWLGAAVCFAKSSPKMYRRIVTWPRIGPVVHDFLAHGVINKPAKTAALCGMGLAAMIIGLVSFASVVMWVSWVGIAIGAAIVSRRPSRIPTIH